MYYQCSLGAQDKGFPDINIITEKVAFEGVTRFEDRQRLPLGISFNSTSLSASLLIQAAYDPLVRLAAWPPAALRPSADHATCVLVCIVFNDVPVHSAQT